MQTTSVNQKKSKTSEYYLFINTLYVWYDKSSMTLFFRYDINGSSLCQIFREFLNVKRVRTWLYAETTFKNSRKLSYKLLIILLQDLFFKLINLLFWRSHYFMVNTVNEIIYNILSKFMRFWRFWKLNLFPNTFYIATRNILSPSQALRKFNSRQI